MSEDRWVHWLGEGRSISTYWWTWKWYTYRPFWRNECPECGLQLVEHRSPFFCLRGGVSL